MRQASTFTPLDAGAASAQGGWGAGLHAALSASAFSIPLSLGAVAVVYARHAPELLAAALLATLLGITIVHLAGLAGRRPVLYSARFLEATTLAALLENAAARLPAWGIPDTLGTRMAALVAVGACAGLVVALLYLVRANRFTRYIPTPVYAGFSNSIAVALVVGQAGALLAQLGTPGVPVALVLAVAIGTFAAGLALRRWMPRWPAAAGALALGLLAGVLAKAGGLHLPMVGSTAVVWTLPAFSADFGAFASPDLPWSAISGLLAGHALVLGAVMFLNSSITSQVLTHHDDLPADTAARSMPAALACALAGLAGAAPISGSTQTSLAAARSARLGPGVLLFAALIAAAVAVSGVLGWVPLAAVAGTLAGEAWAMADRESLRLALRWLKRQPLRPEARENLALVAAVTASAVLVNMVAAVFTGLLLGLVLFAARNARRPVRAVLSGREVASNCARSRADIQKLEAHGDELRVMELEGDLFFVAVESLESRFTQVLREAECVVVDWTRVRHVDTSVIHAVGKLHRIAAEHGVPLFHVDPSRTAPDVAAALQPVLGTDVVAEDLDHALELAENHVLSLHAAEPGAPATTLLDAISLLRGLDEDERQVLEAQMPQRLYRAGEVVMSAGEPGDELMVVLHGSASILVPGPRGAMARIAGVRRGGMLGEMAFLDRAPRSATVVAEEDLSVAVLTRAQYERLSGSSPALIRKVLSNLALDLATRLRHTSRLATERQARR